MLIAYRSWLLGLRSGMLYSFSAPNRELARQRYCWETATQTAACQTHLRKTGPPYVGGALVNCVHVPDQVLGSKCGIYALRQLQPMFPGTAQDAGYVVGVVGLWGEVHVHELGYRAQHARVIAVTVPARKYRRAGPTLRLNGKAYPDVRIYQDHAAMAADWCEEEDGSDEVG
jgi:hypothetical protein